MSGNCSRILVVGAGRIGLTVAAELAATGTCAVEVADVSDAALKLAETRGLTARDLSAANLIDCTKALGSFDLVVNAAPAAVRETVLSAALGTGTHYIDTLEDSGAVDRLVVGTGSDSVVVAGCGLSPGLVSNMATELVGALEGPIDMVVRVGGLPVNPSTSFGYGFTWDIGGLIAEYSGTCEAIVDGALVTLPSLQQHETFVLNGRPYEAFSTAGGLGNLCTALQPRVRNLMFKTIRYPGHLHLARFLFEELGLKRRRDMLQTVLRYGVPDIVQDVLIIFISVRGQQGGVPAERSYIRKIYHQPMRDPYPTSAMSRTSAAHVCAIIDLIREAKVPSSGMVRHEDIPYELLAANRFLAPLLGPPGESKAH